MAGHRFLIREPNCGLRWLDTAFPSERRGATSVPWVVAIQSCVEPQHSIQGTLRTPNFGLWWLDTAFILGRERRGKCGLGYRNPKLRQAAALQGAVQKMI